MQNNTCKTDSFNTFLDLLKNDYPFKRSGWETPGQYFDSRLDGKKLGLEGNLDATTKKNILQLLEGPPDSAIEKSLIKNRITGSSKKSSEKQTEQVIISELIKVLNVHTIWLLIFLIFLIISFVDWDYPLTFRSKSRTELNSNAELQPAVQQSGKTQNHSREGSASGSR